MTRLNDVFTDDFSAEPYWWRGSPLSAGKSAIAPASVDVAIVGAGYTGLHAAIATARAGLSTVVFDREAAGWGCSTRNGGQISTSIKPTWSTLVRRHGEALAREILLEGQASRDHVAAFIGDEAIECDFRVVGRFHGAHNRRAFKRLASSVGKHSSIVEDGSFLIPQSEQRRELGTDAYHGGIVFPHHASIDPVRYHAGCRSVAESAGAGIVDRCAVNRIVRDGKLFRVFTAQGETIARQVIVATNGYTDGLVPALQRRIIPIGSYIIATEEIPASLMNELMPTDRVLSDTRKLVYYYRPSPDRKRILFGGRVSLSETDPRRSGPKLHAELIRIFPALRNVRISHSWSGVVAYTFDSLMHCGVRDGLHFAMGYCGSGVGMAGYLGMRIGQHVAAAPESESGLQRIPFTTRPLYTGSPWFLAPSVLAFRVRDRLGL